MVATITCNGGEHGAEVAARSTEAALLLVRKSSSLHALVGITVGIHKGICVNSHYMKSKESLNLITYSSISLRVENNKI